MNVGRALAGVLAVLLLAGCGGKHREPPAPVKPMTTADALATALSYAPPDASLLATVGTDPSATGVAWARSLLGRLPGGALATGLALDRVRRLIGAAPGTDLAPLAGYPVVAWSDGGRPAAAWVAHSEPALAALLRAADAAGTLTEAGTDHFTTSTGEILERHGALLLLAPNRAALEAAKARQVGGTGATPALVGAERNGLPGGALAVLLAPGRTAAQAVLARAGINPAPLAQVPYLAALERVAVGLYAEPDGVRVRAAGSTAQLPVEQLPLAPGAAPPHPRGHARLVIGLRDPAQTIAWLRATLRVLDPGRLKGLDQAQAALGKFAGVDLGRDLFGQLTDDATILSPDLRRGVVFADPRDPGAVRGVLGKIGDISDLAGGIAGLLGVDTGGFSVDALGDGTKVIKQGGTEVVRVAVKDDQLVASTIPGVQLAALQGQEPAPPGGLPALGALRVRLDADDAKARLIALLGLPELVRGALGPLGGPLLTARAERGRSQAELFLPVG